MKIITVVGARPQFIKAAMVSRALAECPDIEECIVHTGQHYDHQMSQVFFDELGVPTPAYNLEIGSGGHGAQTGRMLEKLEEVLVAEQPDATLVYGDTNSTLAGALAASKLHIPVVHVEAGLRSYNRSMPEEINRVVTDHLSQALLCPTQQAVDNLKLEGITSGVHLVGDVMYDATLHFADIANSRVNPLARFGLSPGSYILMTCHRASTTDDSRQFGAVLAAASELAERLPILFPMHPRTRNRLNGHGATLHAKVLITEPVSYLEMLRLEKEAALVLTDSGGMQKEAFIYGVPCVTMREDTEWTETIESGANLLAGTDKDQIIALAQAQLEHGRRLPPAGDFYGTGMASHRVATLISTFG